MASARRMAAASDCVSQMRQLVASLACRVSSRRRTQLLAGAPAVQPTATWVVATSLMANQPLPRSMRPLATGTQAASAVALGCRSKSVSVARRREAASAGRRPTKPGARGSRSSIGSGSCTQRQRRVESPPVQLSKRPASAGIAGQSTVSSKSSSPASSRQLLQAALAPRPLSSSSMAKGAATLDFAGSSSMARLVTVPAAVSISSPVSPG